MSPSPYKDQDQGGLGTLELNQAMSGTVELRNDAGDNANGPVATMRGDGSGEAEPNRFEIYKGEGNALVKSEKFDEALKKYDLAWVECRSNDDRAMILNNRGVVYEKQGDTDKAIEAFNKALELKPGYIKVLIRRGIVNRKLKRFDDAIQDISEAHVLAFKNNQTVAGLQDITGELIHDYAEAELQKVTESREFSFPRDQTVRTFFRQFYCDPNCRIWKGLDPFPSAENPGDELKGYLAAMTCMKDCKFKEVVPHCTEEINAEGKYRLEALVLRGSIGFLSGLREEAMADFAAVYDSADASSELKSCAHLKAALLENLWSCSENAAEHFACAEQFWPENADVYYHASLCLVDRGEAIPALALLEKGQEVCPSPKTYPLLHVMALTIKVSYDICLSNPKDAMDRLRQLQLDGVFDTAECYEYYGQTLLLVQDSEEAFKQFDFAKELSGGEKIFELKKVMAQQALKNDPEETLRALEEYKDDSDVGNAALYHMGEMYIMLGKREEAFASIDKSIERSFSVYDTKVRIIGKVDFLYNVAFADHLKKHNVEFLPDPNALRNNALE